MVLKNKKDYSHVEDVAGENIEYVFSQLGIEYENKYRYLTCACPIHGGDNKTGFSFSLEHRTWKCWSTGNACGQEYPSNVFGLVMGVRDVRYPEAVRWLCEILDIDQKDAKNIDREKIDQAKFAKKINKKTLQKKKYEPNCLEKLVDHEYFIKRGYKKETLNDFQCGFAQRGAMYNRIVFPVVDLNEDIVGFSGRIIFDKCEKCAEYHEEGVCGKTFSTRSKWKNSRFLPADEIIYNLYRSKDEILKKQEIIIVEGIPDVMRLHQIGVKNSICLLRASISKFQIRILLSIGYIKTVYLLTDNDVAGKNFKNMHSSYKDEDFDSLSRYFYTKTLSVPGKKDIGELDDEEAIGFCTENGLL